MDIQRKAFEAHIKRIHPDLPEAWYKLDESGNYPVGMQADWELWQAAKAQAIPDGFVVVPIAPILKILDAASSLAPIKTMIEAQEPAND